MHKRWTVLLVLRSSLRAILELCKAFRVVHNVEFLLGTCKEEPKAWSCSEHSMGSLGKSRQHWVDTESAFLELTGGSSPVLFWSCQSCSCSCCSAAQSWNLGRNKASCSHVSLALLWSLCCQTPHKIATGGLWKCFKQETWRAIKTQGQILILPLGRHTSQPELCCLAWLHMEEQCSCPRLLACLGGSVGVLGAADSTQQRGHWGLQAVGCRAGTGWCLGLKGMWGCLARHMGAGGPCLPWLPLGWVWDVSSGTGLWACLCLFYILKALQQETGSSKHPFTTLTGAGEAKPILGDWLSTFGTILLHLIDLLIVPNGSDPQDSLGCSWVVLTTSGISSAEILLKNMAHTPHSPLPHSPHVCPSSLHTLSVVQETQT